jgi:tetratricopeptide (TPR) repeat protein
MQLSTAAARLFRLVGLHPGPDLSTRAAASLAGLAGGEVRPLLAELAQAHLVAEHSPGRYTCHDLLRAYASEQLNSEDDQHAATRRMLLHYTHSANNADRLLDPSREEPPKLADLIPGVTPESVADQAEALAWFNAELPVLLMVIHQDAEFDREVWELAWTMRRFLAHQGHSHTELASLTVALAAAQRLEDPGRQAFAHCFLGCTHVWFGKYEDARSRFDLAQGLYEDAGDKVGEAYVQHYYSWMLEQQERTVEALSHAEQALDLFRAAGHQTGQAKVLNAVGWFNALLGDYTAAIGHCQKALDLQTRLGDLNGAGQTWHSIGYAHDRLGDYPKALECYQAAVELFRGTGYRVNEANVLASLGDTYRNAGDLAAARTAWQQAFDIFDQLGHPGADDARAKLTDIHSG